MRIVSRCAFLAALGALAFVPRVAFSQSGTQSDLLSEIVLDHNGPAAAPDVPLMPPAVSFPIPEGTAEVGLTFTLPGRVIDFREVGATGNGFISDRLIISPYQVFVQSDDNPGGLPRRTDAVLIPREALESFLPLSIVARSDGEHQNTVDQESDTLTITLGSYGPGTGKVDFFGTLVDPPVPEPPDVTEPDLTHVIHPIRFDIEEPLEETGGQPGIISDYVDIMSEIQVKFISSDEPGRYDTGMPVDGFVMENIETGGGVSYGLVYRSDAVPEPSTMVLGALGFAALLGIALRRGFRA
jgi:PEP-CTERM motif